MSVLASRFSPVPTFTTVTSAPGITAPVLSVMVPKTVPSCDCDHPRADSKLSDRANSKHDLYGRGFVHAIAKGIITPSTYFCVGCDLRSRSPGSDLGPLV